MQQQQQQLPHEDVPMTTSVTGDICAICLDPMAKGRAILKTSCGHCFHHSCITAAVAKNGAQCPICRGPLPEFAPAPAPAPPTMSSFAMMMTSSAAPGSLALPPPSPRRHPHHPVPVHHHQHHPAAVSTSFPNSGDADGDADEGALWCGRRAVLCTALESEETTTPAAAAAAASGKPADVQMPDAGDGSGAEAPRLEVSLSSERTVIGRGAHSEFMGMVSIVARGGASAAAPASMPPVSERGIDMVIVADVSGSMSGTKLDMLKTTILRILTVLSPHDRFGMIIFNHTVSRVCGLRYVTSETVTTLRDIVRRIFSSGTTDIQQGLQAGVDMLQSRLESGRVGTIVLLTDGENNSVAGASHEEVRRRICGVAASLVRTTPNTIVHTLGYGEGHDAALCTGVAKSGHGSFVYIESADSLGTGFAAVLGRMTTIVAQHVSVHIAAACGVTIEHVYTQSPCTTTSDGTRIVKIPWISQDEHVDIPIALTVPAAEVDDSTGGASGPGPGAGVDADAAAITPLAVATVTYARAPTFDQTRPAVIVQLLAVKRTTDSHQTNSEPVNVDVLAHRHRDGAARAIHRAQTLADAGNHRSAVQCLREFAHRVRTSRAAATPMCQAILADIRECIARVSPDAYTHGGHASLATYQNQHGHQRSSGMRTTSSAMYTSAAVSQCDAVLSGCAPDAPMSATAAEPVLNMDAFLDSTSSSSSEDDDSSPPDSSPVLVASQRT